MLSDPPPKGLSNIFDICNKWSIVVDGTDINVDLVKEVQCASLVRPLHRTLLASCKAAGVVAPTYLWEQWQSCCKLHKLLLPVAVLGAGGLLTVSDKILPCANHVDDKCNADLVRGGSWVHTTSLKIPQFLGGVLVYNFLCGNMTSVVF